MSDEASRFGTGKFGSQFGTLAASNVKTIIDDALKQTGISTSNVGYRDTALSFLNQVYATALKGRQWKFMNKELSIEMEPPYELGLVSVEEGSHDVIEYVEDGSVPVTKFNATQLGRMFVPKSSRDWQYRIIEVESLSKLKISPGYVDADSTMGLGYEILNDRITLDSKVQQVKSIRPSGHLEMQPKGLGEFRELKSRNYGLKGVPRYYTVVGVDEQAGQLTLEVYPAPDKRYGFHIEYNVRIGRLSDSETCYTVVPPEHNDVLLLGLRAAIYEDQNNIQLADRVNQKATSAWLRMASDYEITDGQPRLQPHSQNYRNRYGRRTSIFYGRKHFGKFD